jgi:Ca2+-binding EF-hand superfamily protein
MLAQWENEAIARREFDALDTDHDGFISRAEAQANPTLANEFNALDVKRRGKLDRADLAGWLID